MFHPLYMNCIFYEYLDFLFFSFQSLTNKLKKKMKILNCSWPEVLLQTEKEDHLLMNVAGDMSKWFPTSASIVQKHFFDSKFSKISENSENFRGGTGHYVPPQVTEYLESK